MNHIAEYIVGVIASILIISTLFIFRKFWAKTAKTYWVRIILAGWMLGNQIFITIFQNITWDWELCHILAWSSIVLMLIPTKIQIDLFMPLVMIGPVLAIAGGIVGTAKDYGFDHYRYYNYYFGHLGILFSYLYIYLYDFTGARLTWKSMKRSAIFALLLLTFVMMWNMSHLPAGSDPLKPVPPGKIPSEYWGENYIYKYIIYNLGLGKLSLLNQYFVLIFGFGPIIMVIGWTLMFFARPIYENRGEQKLKFNLQEDILGIKTTFTKSNYKKIWVNFKSKIKA
ncbi:hypothetical protein ELUMI_v1c04640 [Williamsoniiplasma luminosum]|uniref:TIGR02206 family membrane protein n=1 Tax=Williamsoniiplasma luminosum TaxID=214888 RepID=A0A2K8NVI3_9MOLU|nr:YwaF family protein [Williamsoniiplasma luminosum]ATZ17188.1 hypothetical protein ELUMI_v1c04640 [Williamsoniiplasma luminosum]